MSDYASILEAYSITDLLELNDKTEEELLIFLVEERFITLPSVKPLEFDD